MAASLAYPWWKELMWEIENCLFSQPKRAFVRGKYSKRRESTFFFFLLSLSFFGVFFSEIQYALFSFLLFTFSLSFFFFVLIWLHEKDKSTKSRNSNHQLTAHFFFFSPFSFSFFFTFSTCYRCFASCQLYDAVERGGACCVCELAKAWWRLSPSHLSSIYVLFLFGAGALPWKKKSGLKRKNKNEEQTCVF